MRLEAAGTPPNRTIALACDVALQAEAPVDGGKAAPPKFSMTAYNGGTLTVAYWPLPVVIDIAGMKAKARVPILFAHSTYQVCGQSTEVKKSGSKVELAGIITGEDEFTQGIIAHARNGFVWSASVGVDPLRVLEVKAGATVTANGRTFQGPIYLLQKSELKEVSILAIGADRDAETRIAAAGSEGDQAMTFEQWLIAAGWDPNALTDAQKKSLRAAYNAEQEAGADTDEPTDAPGQNPQPKKKPAKASGTPATPPAPAQNEPADPIVQMNVSAAANLERINAIRKVCGDQHSEICAQAIREGWSVEKAELHVLRASRNTPGQAPSILTGAGSDVPHGLLLEAAACQALRLKTVEKHFEDRVLQAAHTAFRGRIGLQRLVVEAARANGWPHMYFDDGPTECLRAAFSSTAISGILSNIANKALLEPFNAVEQIWRRISRIKPVKDFKTITSYRLTASGKYEKVAPTGELKHGSLGEESFSNKADTYGKILQLTRTDMINDDLGALMDLLAILGGDAGRTINHIFWMVFLDNATFFSAANNNYAEGAATALGFASLSTALQMFRDQKDPNGNPIAISPSLLLLPTALEGTGNSLYKSDQIRDTTASKLTLTTNIHMGSFEPLVSTYLGNSNYPGYSQKKWYLLAAAAVLAVMEVVFLNGNEAPTIESVDPAPDQLGIVLRAFHDFGCSKQDSRGGVAMKGEV